MKSSIIQQCPNCGCYCEATSKGAFARMVGTVLGQSESVGSFGGKYLGNLGKFAGKVFGGVTGAPEGVFNAIAGDRYQFTCPNCKASWSTNTDEGDETNSFNLWHEVVGNVERVHAVLAAKNQNEI